MSAAWPAVVGRLLTALPALPGWASVEVFDTDPVTADSPPQYAVVGRTSADDTSGSYVRQPNPNGFQTDEVGTVRLHVVTQTGDADPAGVRTSGFGLVDAFQDWVDADQTLGGVLSVDGTVHLTVDVQSLSNSAGTAQSLVVSVNYSTRT